MIVKSVVMLHLPCLMKRINDLHETITSVANYDNRGAVNTIEEISNPTSISRTCLRATRPHPSINKDDKTIGSPCKMGASQEGLP